MRVDPEGSGIDIDGETVFCQSYDFDPDKVCHTPILTHQHEEPICVYCPPLFGQRPWVAYTHDLKKASRILLAIEARSGRHAMPAGRHFWESGLMPVQKTRKN